MAGLLDGGVIPRASASRSYLFLDTLYLIKAMKSPVSDACAVEKFYESSSSQRRYLQNALYSPLRIDKAIAGMKTQYHA